MGIRDIVDKKKEKIRDLIGSATQKVNPNKISRFTKKLAENAATYAVQEGYKYLPGGTAVVNIVSKTVTDLDPENKSTPDSKNGREQKNDIAEERLKDPPFFKLSGATREKMKDDTSSVKPDNKVSTDSETTKNGSAPLEANRKRDSVRSD